MSKSWVPHYRKKYPRGKVHRSDVAFDVWNEKGEHVIALRKDGHGNLICQSEDHECLDVHDLAPMPGCPGFEDMEIKDEYYCARSGKLKSVDQIKKDKKAADDAAKKATK